MSNDILISTITDDLNHLAHYGHKGQEPGKHKYGKWQPQAKYAKGRQDPNKKLKPPMANPKPATTTTTTTTSSSSTTFTSGSDSGFTSGNSSNSDKPRSNKPRNNKPQNNSSGMAADRLTLDGTMNGTAEAYVKQKDYKTEADYKAALKQARIIDYVNIARQIEKMRNTDPAMYKVTKEKLDGVYKDVLKDAKKYKI